VAAVDRYYYCTLLLLDTAVQPCNIPPNRTRLDGPSFPFLVLSSFGGIRPVSPWYRTAAADTGTSRQWPAAGLGYEVM